MPKIHRTALVEYSAQQMYDLVNDVDCYPEFVPMCHDIDVHLKSETEIEATLKISKGGVKIDFGTHNDLVKNEQIKIRLIKGPFKRLVGTWIFTPLHEKACKVTLDLEFEFSSKLFAMAVGVVFNSLANSMLDAFCNRAKNVYGDNPL